MATNDNDDDDGFGDFTFAPPYPPPLQSNPATSTDNDDWGDFVNSGGLSHTPSLPKVSTPPDPFILSKDHKIEKNNSDPVQPDSAPALASPGSPFSAWEKPRGALPLSIFGLEEEEAEDEEGSGVGDTSGVNGGEKVVNSNKNAANVSNLIGDMNKNSESGNGSVKDSNGSVSNLFGSNLGPISGSRIDSNTSDLIVDDRKRNGVNGVVSDSNGSYAGLSLEGVNQNPTSLQLVDDKGNSINSNSSMDWQFDWNSTNLNPSKTSQFDWNGTNLNPSKHLQFDWSGMNLNPRKDSANSNSNEISFNGDVFGSVAKETDLNSNKGLSSMGMDFDWNAVNLNLTASKTIENDSSSIAKEVDLNSNKGVSSMGMDFDWNAVNLNPTASKTIENDSSSIAKEVDLNSNKGVSSMGKDFDWNAVNLNPTASKTIENDSSSIAKEVDLNSNKGVSSVGMDFDWNAVTLKPTASKTIENDSSSIAKEVDLNSNKGVSSMGKDFDWNAVNLNPTASKTIENDSSSIAKEVDVNSNKGMNSMGMDFDWNAVNLNPSASKTSENHPSSIAKEVDLNGNNRVNLMRMDFDWNTVNLNPNASKVNENGLISVAKEVDLSNNKGVKSMAMDFDWNAVNLNPSASKSNENESSSVVQEDVQVVDVNEGSENDEDEDDGWEFMAAESNTAAGVDKSENSKNENNHASLNQPNVFSSSWNMLPSDLSSWNLNSSVQNSSTDWLNTNVPKSNGQDGDEKSKGAQVTSEKVSNLPSVGLSFSSWDMLHTGFDNTSSNLNQAKTESNQNSHSVEKDSGLDDADAWGFKSAEPEQGLKTGNSKDNQSHAMQADLSKAESGLQADFHKTNTSWNMTDVGGGWLDSNLTGVSSQTKQTDVKSLDEDEDWGTDDGWEFKAATDTESKVENQRNMDDGRHDAGVATNKFDFGNAGQNNSDLFATSQIEKFGEWDAGFDFNPSSSTQKDSISNLFFQSQPTLTENKLHSSFDGNSGDNSWAFNDPFPETGLTVKEEPEVAEVSADQEAFTLDREIQGTKVSLDKNKGALPLSIFGEEEQESGDPVIDEDTTAQKPNSNSVVGTKSTPSVSPSVSITDLISSLYSQAEQSSSVSHAQEATENPAENTDGATNPNLANASDDFDDDSWNFQDASTGAGVEDQATSLGATNSNLAYASDNFDDDSWNFQDANAGPADGAGDQITSLGLGEIHTEKILKLISSEDQSSYVTAWYKMLLVCSQELNHGVSIWKQLFEKDAHHQVLLTPQGKINIIALGEIYRTVQVLGASARVYAPWLANSTTGSAHVRTLLGECSTLWSSSGLEAALRNISDLADIEYDESLEKLLESSKFICDVDALSLSNNILSTQAPTCGLSGLPSEMVPGLKTAIWNGKCYFLPLANLWANLISRDPPNLPSIHVEGQ